MRNSCYSLDENVKGRSQFFLREWLHVKKISNATLSQQCERVQYINMSSGVPVTTESELGFPTCKTWETADHLRVWPSRTLHFVVRLKRTTILFGRSLGSVSYAHKGLTESNCSKRDITCFCFTLIVSFYLNVTLVINIEF
jgi:hypothetical protein